VPASSLFCCPVCAAALERGDTGYACVNGHHFDRAREGYVNLLPSHHRGREPGDSAAMMRARRAFLDTGAFEPLAAALAAATAGCGEGWFTRRLRGERVAGVDISRPGIRLAARRDPSSEYAVASVFHLPVPDNALDTVVSNFGPVDAGELHRVLQPEGIVVAAHPGPRHLYGLRALVYDDPTEHEVKEPLRDAPELFERVTTTALTHAFAVEDVTDLLAMTPYVWHLDEAARVRVGAAGGLATNLDVRVTTYRRRSASPASEAT
jgi:23S rRNA (guanine745-N1)-methyltransferase